MKNSNSDIKAVANMRGYINIDWLEKNDIDGFIHLSKNTSKKEVDAFISEMFNYVNIDAGTDINMGIPNAVEHTKKKDAATLGMMIGGLLFYDGDKKIFPGCCCGLESFNEIISAIENKQGAWLGHDPSAYFEYTDTELIVWSVSSEELNEYNGIFEKYSVHFKYSELRELLVKAKNDFYEFLTIALNDRFIELGLLDTKPIILSLLKSFKLT